MTNLAVLLLASLAATSAEQPVVYGPTMDEGIERPARDDADDHRLSIERMNLRPERREGTELRWRGRKVRMRVPFG